MAKATVLELSESEHRELVAMRDHHAKPYMRERAAALLKVAAGQSARQVALAGLLRHRHPDTLYAWLHRFRTEGSSGLWIRAGRGRKPAFSPSLPDQ